MYSSLLDTPFVNIFLFFLAHVAFIWFERNKHSLKGFKLIFIQIYLRYCLLYCTHCHNQYINSCIHFSVGYLLIYFKFFLFSASIVSHQVLFGNGLYSGCSLYYDTIHTHVLVNEPESINNISNIEVYRIQVSVFIRVRQNVQVNVLFIYLVYL